ncbi:beta-ketoacyl synthase N-terminal-like domain-containing protein [Sphaerisporangium flaviroseum]|uniref:Beta-ketoacyl synthase N-terminal-like domain-containing protein n=1 Tax=Sphaerisporangium flaviroseum TaxID=509199 RepID=A0ABP7I645_9ACTN
MTGTAGVDRPPAGRPPVVRTMISGWSAVSPYGLDRADFAAGLREGRRETAVPPGDGGDAPVERACLVPGFDIREVLGRKGTRSMDRVTALAVATAGRLLRAPGGDRIPGIGAEAALVLGTNVAGAQSTVDFARDSLTKEKPYFVDPARFPNAVLNCAAAQCAIWHGLQGPNTTVSGGRASGLLALNYAMRLQRSGRAGPVLCGAAEEFSTARAWFETLSEPDRPPEAVLGEGCAMVLLEPYGRPGEHGRAEPAEVLAVEFGVHCEPEDVHATLASCVSRAFASTGESPDRLWAVAGSGGPGPEGSAEEAVITGILGDRVPVRLRGTDLVGDTNAASAAFGLVALLAWAENEPVPYGRTALVTAVDRDGVAGCALLRMGPSKGEAR